MYQKVTLDLTTAFTGKDRIFPLDSDIDEVLCLSFPLGIAIQLAFGDGELFTVNGPFSFKPTGKDLCTRGLYWANPQAAPGVTIELLVSQRGV